jgi:hypothetical protein
MQAGVAERIRAGDVLDRALPVPFSMHNFAQLREWPFLRSEPNSSVSCYSEIG